MTDTISIDSGSSYMKAWDGRSEPVMFPGVVRELFPGEDLAGSVEVDGRRWLVGDSLLEERGAALAPDRSRWFHGSLEQHVQVCHALGQLGASGAFDTLVVSLPYERSTERPFLDAVSRRKRFAWGDDQGEHLVTFENINVMPQGVGALQYQREQGAEAFDTALMVDVGSCTTDLVAIRSTDGKWGFIRDSCVSDQEVSTSLFFELLHREVNRIAGFAGRRFGYYDLMPRLMVEGEPTISHQGELISLAPYVARAKVEFTRRLKDVVRGYARSLWDELDQIILTGGGAHCVSLEVWRDPRTQILGPCANVLGQFSMTKE